MNNIEIIEQIISHEKRNPFWLWDFVTDPYSAEAFAFEMVQTLKPSTDDEQIIIEDLAKTYVTKWRSKWDTLSRKEKFIVAEYLEHLGLDIDYQLI